MKSRVTRVSTELKSTWLDQRVADLPLNTVQVSHTGTLYALQGVRWEQVPVATRSLASLAGLIARIQADRLLFRAQIRQTTPVKLPVNVQPVVADSSGNLSTDGTSSNSAGTIPGIRSALQTAIVPSYGDLVTGHTSTSHTLIATLLAHTQIRLTQPGTTLPPSHLEPIEDRNALIPSHVTNTALFKLLVVRQRCTICIR